MPLPTHTKECGHCGIKATNHMYQYYNFQELLTSYRVGYVDICDKCAARASLYVNYYGVKKQKDIDSLHKFLINGKLPMKHYFMLMNAGYY